MLRDIFFMEAQTMCNSCNSGCFGGMIFPSFVQNSCCNPCCANSSSSGSVGGTSDSNTAAPAPAAATRAGRSPVRPWATAATTVLPPPAGAIAAIPAAAIAAIRAGAIAAIRASAIAAIRTAAIAAIRAAPEARPRTAENFPKMRGPEGPRIFAGCVIRWREGGNRYDFHRRTERAAGLEPRHEYGSILPKA